MKKYNKFHLVLDNNKFEVIGETINNYYISIPSETIEGAIQNQCSFVQKILMMQ